MITSVTDINEVTPKEQFPQAFWLQCTREDPQTGTLETEYLPWGDEHQSPRENRLDEIFFKLSDVEAYEQERPWLKHKLVDPDKAWKNRLSLDANISPVEVLEQKLTEVEEKLIKSNTTKKIRKKRIEKLEKELADTKEGNSGVDAKKWGHTVEATFKLFILTLQSSGQKLKRAEFQEELNKLYPDYHTTVLDLAWKALPDEFKHPRGRPKQTT